MQHATPTTQSMTQPLTDLGPLPPFPRTMKEALTHVYNALMSYEAAKFEALEAEARYYILGELTPALEMHAKDRTGQKTIKAAATVDKDLAEHLLEKRRMDEHRRDADVRLSIARRRLDAFTVIAQRLDLDKIEIEGPRDWR